MISTAVRKRVREQSKDRCGYCLSEQRYVMGRLEIDHIIPQARGGTDDESNLWLSCRMCNGFKGAQITGHDPISKRQVKLFNPRTQRWSRHFRWSADGTQVIGRTACGRATVIALQMNNYLAVMVRREWVGAGWFPPRNLD